MFMASLAYRHFIKNCMCVCLPVCVSACVSACLSSCLSVCLRVREHTHVYVCTTASMERLEDNLWESVLCFYLLVPED